VNETQYKMSSSAAEEIDSGKRFAFGENWTRFLTHLDDSMVERAMASLQTMLGAERLDGAAFLDMGSGSGLFSLAARRLGAKVCSFDYDPKSVTCTLELKRRYFANDPDWSVQEGSVLDTTFLGKLPQADVVYSWGVLHHTGRMYDALENAAKSVRPGGQLFIALYNDQGWISGYWTAVKRIYNGSTAGALFTIVLHAPYLIGVRWLVRALSGRRTLERGMSLWHDMIDWLGGYPFEVATPAQIERFYVGRGFALERSTTCGRRMGCNEFVFRRAHPTQV
jgi:2-polyprenyl-6-hydroxyphenyl methylase/3-demethylubiquinone-9 3-methyltransferase